MVEPAAEEEALHLSRSFPQQAGRCLLPLPTGWQEVDKRVTEVMDQVHDLQLQLLQEIGFVREIDQALSKSLMVESSGSRSLSVMTEWGPSNLADQHGGCHR